MWAITLFLLLYTSLSIGQNIAKKGGIAFRIDDNPSISRLNSIDSLFGLYNMHFAMAITPWTLPLSPTYVSALKNYITHGHEVMDNTPMHHTSIFKVLNLQDTSLYSNHPGVDHIAGEKVCLKYASIDTSQPHNEWKINLFGNLVITYTPGEFQDLMMNPDFFAIYLSSPVNRLCIYYDVKAYNPNDPDSLYVRSFWDEPLSLGNHWYFDYHKLTHRNVILHPSAIQLLGHRSLDIYDSLDIPRPITWIHPQGPYPYISGYELKSYMGDSLGFTGGSNFVNFAYRCYNEYDPFGIAPFGLQPSITSIEQQSFHNYRHSVANSLARHFVTFDAAKLLNPMGGWNSLLSRYDSLLKWCQVHNIPVRTHNQWKALLYDSIPGPVSETFPRLNVDLDLDQYPDGFESTGVQGFFDPTDGVTVSSGKSFAIHGSGIVCKVLSLGGLAKGSNKFTIWTKVFGTDSNNVAVIFSYPGTSTTDTLFFKAYSGIWTSSFDMTVVPQEVSIMNVEIHYTDLDTTPDTLKVSGMSLRSAGFLTLSEYPDQIHNANEPFQNVNLNDLVIDTLYNPSTIDWEVHGFHSMNLSVQPGNILSVMKPLSFWTGKDSCYTVATSPDGIKDSCFMRFESLEITEGCSGDLVTLTLLDTMSNDIIQWTSEPFDSTLSNPHIYNPTVAPKVTTFYRVLVINPLGPTNRDSIKLYRYPYPDPQLPHDTLLCSGDELFLEAHGGGSYLWSTGDTTASITVTALTDTAFSVIVTSVHHCSAYDTTVVTARQKPNVKIWGLWPSYCTDGYPTTMIGQPAGGTFGGSPGIEGNMFYPSRADTGMNHIWYAYYDTLAGCPNTDTVHVNIIPLPQIFQQPDTNLCADKYLILRAGPGMDNYLWSDGTTDSVTVVDSTGYGLGLVYFKIYVTKDGCASVDTALINFIECPIGIRTYEESGVLLWPNPVLQTLYINYIKDVGKKWTIKIHSIHGDLVLFREGAEESLQLDLQYLTSGVYIIQISRSWWIFRGKLIKI